MQIIRDWFQRYLSDPQAILLVVILLILFSTILIMGEMIAPILVSLVLAYLLEGVVRRLQHEGSNRGRVVILTYLTFIALVSLILIGLTPLLWSQVVGLIRELPSYISRGQELLMALPEHHPYLTEGQVDDVVQTMQRQIGSWGKFVLSFSLSSIPSLITLLVYLILVPVLIFFFMRDKFIIQHWFLSFLPKDRNLSNKIWLEVDQQIGNYIRGKFWEIIVVGMATFLGFLYLDLKYATLLAVLVGLSVLIPFLGAAVVTIPVAMVAYFQFGWGSEFAWVMIVYGIIQALDGNVLVPLLFSEVVNLHPVAIIASVLVFGGIWGVWGVFFAIPLATLVNAIISAWPRPNLAP